ncbi:CAP domain-containing protein [Corallococcus terminator]|uniref:CAP domain-containing protein n=1 Tax=Corallococcus terminator TaxID=2316733 RepID=A0A3A8JT63_9BACT|nr:CAP domain-containing protein [Corallococcus terminator]RKG92803.1 CAP domain-containing protein [Corallococcus terminator]
MSFTSRSVSLMLLGTALLGGCDAAPTTTPINESTVLPTDDLGTVESRTNAQPAGYCTSIAFVSGFSLEMEQAVIALVNQRRATGAICGGVAKPPVPPLTAESRLNCSARNHALDMGKFGYFGNIGQSGWTPLRRITLAGYTPLSYAEENIAAGYTSTAAAVVDAWMATPRDCNNIMNPAHLHVGVGQYTVPGSTYGYWVQDFGRP